MLYLHSLEKIARLRDVFKYHRFFSIATDIIYVRFCQFGHGTIFNFTLLAIKLTYPNNDYFQGMFSNRYIKKTGSSERDFLVLCVAVNLKIRGCVSSFRMK